MKKLSLVALLSLAALGLGAERAAAFSWLHHCCCGCKCTVVCKPYNAFSPPCCYPVGHGWCCGLQPFAYPGCSSGCCGPSMGTPSGPGPEMPPASAGPIPQYMPPAPAEADGQQQSMMPMMPMPMQMQGMMPMPMQGGMMPPQMQMPMQGMMPMPMQGMPMQGGMPMQPVMYQPMPMGYYPVPNQGVMPMMPVAYGMGQ